MEPVHVTLEGLLRPLETLLGLFLSEPKNLGRKLSCALREATRGFKLGDILQRAHTVLATGGEGEAGNSGLLLIGPVSLSTLGDQVPRSFP